MAGRIPQQFIDDLLNRIDIVEVIDSRVPLKKKGKEYSACCPFHTEKTPSFTVSQNKQFYHCFGCKANGTAVGFLMEYEHLSFPDAIEELARSQGLEIPYEGGQKPDPSEKKTQTDLYDLMQETDLFFREQLRQHPQAETAVNYLKQRGLSGEIAKDFGIGFAPDAWDSLLKALGNSKEQEKALVTAGMLIQKDNGKCYDRFRDRIMFPIRDRRGRCIAFGGRILPRNQEKSVQDGGDTQGRARAAGDTTAWMQDDSMDGGGTTTRKWEVELRLGNSMEGIGRVESGTETEQQPRVVSGTRTKVEQHKDNSMEGIGRVESETKTEQLPRKPEAAKYLNSPETPLFHKGRELYGLYEARQALRDIPCLLVVEGYMDVVALAQYGIRYAVATLGTATTPEHLHRLFQLTSEVVFCFDGDRAGKDAAWRALNACLPEMRDGRETRFMFLPENEDPDSYIRQKGKNVFETEIKQACSFAEYLFQQLTHEADVSGIGGRAKLVEKGRPMLSQMPDGIYRKLMFEQLEKLGRVELADSRASATSHSALKSLRKPSAETQTTRSPIRKAISLLLYQPGLAKSWKDTGELTKLDLPGMDLLLAVLEILSHNPDLTTSALIERWRGLPSGHHLTKLANWHPELNEPAAVEIEFLALMNALKKQSVEMRYDDLQAKLDQGKLSETEMVEYKKLLQQIYDAKSASKSDL